MAKKSRRVRPKLSQAQLVQPTKEALVAKPVAEEITIQPIEQPKATDFRTEYQYVVSDLKRIGLLAAAMLGGLIILSVLL